MLVSMSKVSFRAQPRPFIRELCVSAFALGAGQGHGAVRPGSPTRVLWGMLQRKPPRCSAQSGPCSGC